MMRVVSAKVNGFRLLCGAVVDLDDSRTIVVGRNKKGQSAEATLLR